jgi:hypothetical protein
MAKDRNLTGVWNGLYSYPKYLEPVFFVATLISHGDHFSGSTHEAVEGRSGAPLTLFASVDGVLDEGLVSFRKTYDGAGGWSHSLMYFGMLSADRNEIEGQWVLPAGWSGRFMMIRRTGVSESVVRRQYEKIGM